MFLLSRKVDTHRKQVALIIFFVAMIGIFIIRCILTVGDATLLSTLNPGDIHDVQFGGTTYEDQHYVESIIHALTLSKPYYLANEGCLKPQPMTLHFRNGELLTVAVGYSQKNAVAVFRVITTDIPSCLMEGTLSSPELADILQILKQ